MSPPAWFVGRALGAAAQLFVLGVVCLPVLLVLTDTSIGTGAPTLVAVLGLGSLGIAAPGTLQAALVGRARGQELLLPVLLFPLLVPVLLAAVKATALAFQGDPMQQGGSWLSLLAAFTVLFWSLGAVLYGRLVAVG